MYQYFIYNIWNIDVLYIVHICKIFIRSFASFCFASFFSFWVFNFLIFIAPEITPIYHQCSLCLRPPAPHLSTLLHETALKYHQLTASWFFIKLSMFGGYFTTTTVGGKNKTKKNTKKKSFTKGEWGLSKWKCTWCVFVSVSAVSCWSDHAGAEVSVCSLSQVCVFHVVEAVVRFVVRCQWGYGVSRACLCLVIVLLYVSVTVMSLQLCRCCLDEGRVELKLALSQMQVKWTMRQLKEKKISSPQN